MKEKTMTGDAKAVQQFASDIVERSTNDTSRRFLLGIVGYPGAGKSTLAHLLVDEINRSLGKEVSIVVPMDGFHYSNQELERRGLLPLKGVPETFDASGFVKLISQLNLSPDKSVFSPRFDRSIEASIDNDIEVTPNHKIVVSEGNYLLLDKSPWNELPELFDEIWFINSSIEEIVPRLRERHFAGGRDEAATKTKMESTDLPNARLIEETKARANRVIEFK